MNLAGRAERGLYSDRQWTDHLPAAAPEAQKVSVQYVYVSSEINSALPVQNRSTFAS